MMSLSRAVVLSLVVAAPAAWGQELEPPPLSLAEALAAARLLNPTLQAARLREAVDRAAIDVAREIPNPEARYERSKETPREALGLTQLVELPPKRSRRVAAARAAADTGRAEVAQVEAEIAVEVRQAFFQLAAAQRRAEVSLELQALARRVRDAASARFEVGDVSRLDVLQADVALLQADNEATAEAGTRRAAMAELNALVGRDPLAVTVVSAAIDNAPPLDVALVLQAAESGNTAIAVLDRQIAEAEARSALARAERWPEPTVEAAVTHLAEPEFTWGWRFAASVSLPLFNRHRAAVRVEEATLAVRRAERVALAKRVRGAVVAALGRAAAQQQRYLRFRDEILPKSHEVEDMAQESYRVGHSPLSALLQALQAARELRGQALAAASEYQSALVELEQALTVGGRP